MKKIRTNEKAFLFAAALVGAAICLVPTGAARADSFGLSLNLGCASFNLGLGDPTPAPVVVAEPVPVVPAPIVVEPEPIPLPPPAPRPRHFRPAPAFAPAPAPRAAVAVEIAAAESSVPATRVRGNAVVRGQAPEARSTNAEPRPRAEVGRRAPNDRRTYSPVAAARRR